MMDGDGPRQLAKPVDFCRLRPSERQRVRDAWLSVPKPVPTSPSEGSNIVRRTAYGLSVPALKAKCTPHIEMLAVAKYPVQQMHYVTQAEREMQKELEEEMTKEELKWLKRKFFPVEPSGVKKSALYAKTTPRIDNMALAKLRILKHTKKNYFFKLNENQRNSLNRSIKEHYDIFKGNYPPDADLIYVIAGGVKMHASCSGKHPEKAKRVKCICELNKNQRKNFRKRMKLMGLPKKYSQPDKGPDRGPKKKIKDFEPWLSMMCQPRYNVLSEKPYDPYKVKSSAKLYNPTEKILKMAKPRMLPPPPPLLDMEGNELPPRREWSYNSRRRIVATQRTIELAIPKFVKKKTAKDVKEDPFAVQKRALTAICSPRIKELAEPRRR